MSKVRINDLARELEVKSKAILDVLLAVGVTEKKTHSSSLEENEAERVRVHFRANAEAQGATSKSARITRGEEEIKTKIDLSNISRPGDVLKAITQQKGAVAPPPVRAAMTPVAPPAAASVPRPVAVPPPAKPPVSPVVSQPAIPPSPSPAQTPAAPPRPIVTTPVERPA